MKSKSIIKSYSLIVLCCVHGCDYNENRDAITTQQSYYLYLGNWGSNEIFVVDTDSNVVVDTLGGFDDYIWELAVTQSGAKLYVSTRYSPVNRPGKVYSVDLLTRKVSIIWTGIASDVFSAPNGEIFIFSYEPRLEEATAGTTYVGIIDTLSDAITFIDTLDIRTTGYNYQSVAFDGKSPILYAVREDNRLFAYNFETREIERIYENIHGPLLHIIISPDGKTLYVAGGPVFDLEQDSVIAWVGGNSLGSLALSPDGEYLYITDPGSYLLPIIIPSGKIYIFETSSNTHLGYIDVKQPQPWLHSPATDRIVIMPDGETAYVPNWINLVFVIDLQLEEVIEILPFGPIETQIVQVVLGKIPTK
jgi:DNA-binding beta-propeller fold protein YncE